MLSRSEALKFIREVLHIKDAEYKNEFEKLGLVDEILRAMQCEIPYHNVCMIQHPQVPTEEEAIQACLTGQGGSCIHLNYFLMSLLKALGYDVYLSAASLGTSPFPEAHMICIARGIGKTHHKHLMDIGGGFPMFEAVPLHDLPKTYLQSGLKVMYTKSETEGKFHRWHTKRDSVVTRIDFVDVTHGQWRQIFTFIDKELNFSHFEKYSKEVFTSLEPHNPLQRNLYLTRFPGRKDAAMCLIGRKLITTDDSGAFSVQILSMKRLKATIFKHFPEVPQDDVLRSMAKIEKHLMNDKSSNLFEIVRIAFQYCWYWVKAWFE